MDNAWIAENLQNALDTWDEKLTEIWQLLTVSPAEFRDGRIWEIIKNINGILAAFGAALTVLFFFLGVFRTAGSLEELRRPEAAVKLFLRFVAAKALVTHGMELMNAMFGIFQGMLAGVMGTAAPGGGKTVLPDEIKAMLAEAGTFSSIPLWAVSLIGCLAVTIVSFILILTVYGRMFRLYMYTAISPIPLSTIAGEPTAGIGYSFLKSYCGVLLEGVAIALACLIFS
ncbi:MAG: hypothetical protein ACOX6J_05620, partial [Oscillospiraceae bacterium]